MTRSITQVVATPSASHLKQSVATGVRLRLAAGLCVLAVCSVATLPAATIVWSGASGTDTNWSNGINWEGLVAPGSSDEAKFFDTAAVTTVGVPNNLVDATITLSSLQYGNSNNFHTTVVAPGQAINLTGANGLYAFSGGNPGAARNLTNTITGAGGSLYVSNTAAFVSLNQANTVGGPSRATLNLSGLDAFNTEVRAIGLGSTVFPNSGSAAQRCGGQLILAKSNYITLSLSDTLANYQTSTSRTNAIELSRNPGNNPGVTSALLLGQTNVIYLDSISCGMDKSGNNSTASSGLVAFNPAFTNNNPGAYFRGISGDSSRVKWWSVGDGNASSSSSNGGRGTNDFSNGTVDILVDVLSLGRECNAANTGWAGPHLGILTFDRGIIDVNTAYLGNQPFTQPTSVPGCAGILNVNGASALLKVNTTLILGHATGTSVTALKTAGTLNLRNGGTAQINTVTVGANSTTNVIRMDSATLILSNTVASPGKGLFAFATTNSTLQLNVTGVTNVVVTNLLVGGTTNVIFPASVAVFASYPKQITLIKYTAMTGAFNFGFGANVLPASAPDAYLSNNVANSSIDLVLPTDPRPVITSTPNNFAGAPDLDVVLASAYTGVAPLTAQWRKDGVDLVDGPTGSGSTNSGVTAATLTVFNAQDLDSGSYVIVVTNVFGSATSTPPTSVTISTNDIAPIVSGPVNQTVVQSNNATFTASVSGNPAPFIQWQKNGSDITGENSASLTITNAQYPADEAPTPSSRRTRRAA